MNKLEIARKKSARGTIMALLYDNQSAPMLVRTLGMALTSQDDHAMSEIGVHLYYLADKGYIRAYANGEDMRGDVAIPVSMSIQRDALVRITADGIDLMEGTVDDEGVLFGDPDRN